MLVNSYTLLSNDLEGRIQSALAAMRAGMPVILLDDFDRENEADLIMSAEKLTNETMALLIRECSGIVCLCLPAETVVSALELPPMSPDNGSRYGTPFHGLHRGARRRHHGRVGRRPRHHHPRRHRAECQAGRPGAPRPCVPPARRARWRARAPWPHGRLGRPVAHGGPESGRRAVRTDEPGRHHDARRRYRTLRRAAWHADPDHRRDWSPGASTREQ